MKSLFVVLCLTMAYLSVGAQKIYKFQNTKLSDEKRIDALLEELMLEEKIALLGSDLAVPRLGILSCRHHEAYMDWPWVVLLLGEDVRKVKMENNSY